MTNQYATVPALAADNQILKLVTQDNLPPFSQEAEEALLGCIQAHPPMYYQMTDLQPEHFYMLRNGIIWSAIRACMVRDKDLTLITLSDELRGMGKLDDIGNMPYLMQLATNAPPHYQAGLFAEMIRRCAGRRMLLKAADEIRSLALDMELKYPDVKTAAQQAFFTATSSGGVGRSKTLREVILKESGRMDALIEARGRGETPMLGLPTGFTGVDNLLGGLQAPDLLLLAGRPGMGKSAFITSMLLYLGLLMLPSGRRPRIGVFPMEMSGEQFTNRMIAAEADIPMLKLRNAHLMSEDENKRRVTAEGKIGMMDIMVDDSASPTPEYVTDTCYRWQMQGGLDLVILDYLGRMTPSPTTKGKSTNDQVGDIAGRMKSLAKDLDIPVFGAHQLSRAVEQRQDKRPMLSDLRDSGEMEQEADIVMFLYRDSVYNEASEHPNSCDVIVAKHRNGPTGMPYLYFNKSRVRFENGERRHIDLSVLG